MTVFIAGSISIKSLATAVTQRLDSIVQKKHSVVVGDAAGVDTAVQRHLHKRGYKPVTVYCINQARNNLGNWPVVTVANIKGRPRRSDFGKKDLAMAQAADVGFMIWDDQSSGTLNNVLNLLDVGKKSLVYAQETDEFLWITGPNELATLVDRIPKGLRDTVERKIDLSARIERLTSDVVYQIPAIADSVGEPQLDLFGFDGNRH